MTQQLEVSPCLKCNADVVMLKVTVNEQVLLNNFPEGEDYIALFSNMTEERRRELE